jgi:adenosylcobinamide hydrolase
MDYFQLPGGYRMAREAKALIIELNEAARVLSTSHLNGGYRDNIRYLFNFCEVFDSPDNRCEMRAPTNEGHLSSIAEELDLNPALTTGLSTAAHMRHIRPHSEHYRDFSVTAIATAGIDVNGSRVGDPACWHEKDGVPVLEKPGTINIILLIDADLTQGAMARALVTCTEAKVAALQEVQAPSLYSSGLATGSGTDGTIVVCNSASATNLTSAGHHSKLGEFVGRVVKDTMKEALVAEDGVDKYTGGSALKRLRRFGLTEDRLMQIYRASRAQIAKVDANSTNLAKASEAAFFLRIKQLDSDPGFIARVSVFANLLDLLQWNLIGIEDASRIGENIFLGPNETSHFPNLQMEQQTTPGTAVEDLITRFAYWLF